MEEEEAQRVCIIVVSPSRKALQLEARTSPQAGSALGLYQDNPIPDGLFCGSVLYVPICSCH